MKLLSAAIVCAVQSDGTDICEHLRNLTIAALFVAPTLSHPP